MKEALQWIWKDHGKVPVSTHLENSKSRAAQWLIPGEDWQVVSEGHNWSEGPAVTADGTLYFTDVPDHELYKITPGGTQTLITKETKGANGIALGPDGKLYTASNGSIYAFDLATEKLEPYSTGTNSNDVVVSHSGHLYYTDPQNKTIWHVDRKTKKRTQVAGLKSPNGIGLSTDQTQLFVCDFHTRNVYAYSIDEATGMLSNKQAYYHAQFPTDGKGGALDGQCTAASGHLLVGTEAGLQIFDQPGRLQLNLPRPSPEDGRVNYCCLHKDILYIATRHRIYKRKVKLQAAKSWEAPVDPKNPRL